MPEKKVVLEALSHAAQSPAQLDYPLARECSFRLGGPALYFCAPKNPEALRDTLAVIRDFGLKYILLGGGANLLFRDEGFPGVVISTKQLAAIRIEADQRVRVEAGVDNAAFTAFTLQNELTGFEWASGLPGTVGGGVYMNAKCYGSAFADLVTDVTALSPAGDLIRLAAKACHFDYKTSVFQSQPYLITEVTLQLAPGTMESIRQRTEEILEDRKNKGQFLFPSAGCAFKNHYASGQPAGCLIETCGLKGRQVGGVRVFEQHANFIINAGQGKTQDVVDLMKLVEHAVWEKHHIRLEPEIRVVP